VTWEGTKRAAQQLVPPGNESEKLEKWESIRALKRKGKTRPVSKHKAGTGEQDWRQKNPSERTPTQNRKP